MRYDFRVFPRDTVMFLCQKMGVTAERKWKVERIWKVWQDAKIRYCNCGGEHGAAYIGCPLAKASQRGAKIKSNEQSVLNRGGSSFAPSPFIQE